MAETQGSPSLSKQSRWNDFFFLITLIAGICFLLYITDSYKYLSLQYLSRNKSIWHSLFCLGAVVSLIGSLLVYWASYKKGFPSAISNDYVRIFLFYFCGLITIGTIVYALFYINNYEKHINATLFYFGLFIVWDALAYVFSNNETTGTAFKNYAIRLFVANDGISFIGIALLYFVFYYFIGEEHLVVGRGDLSIPLKEILMGGAIGFQMLMSGMIFIFEAGRDILSN